MEKRKGDHGMRYCQECGHYNLLTQMYDPASEVFYSPNWPVEAAYDNWCGVCRRMTVWSATPPVEKLQVEA